MKTSIPRRFFPSLVLATVLFTGFVAIAAASILDVVKTPITVPFDPQDLILAPAAAENDSSAWVPGLVRQDNCTLGLVQLHYTGPSIDTVRLSATNYQDTFPLIP